MVGFRPRMQSEDVEYALGTAFPNTPGSFDQTIVNNRANFEFNTSAFRDGDYVLMARGFNEHESVTDSNQINVKLNNPILDPVLSKAGGTYFEPFKLSIECQTKGAKLIYTLDGSEPKDEVVWDVAKQVAIPPLVYKEPLEIKSNTTFKVRAFFYPYKKSNLITAQYTIEAIGGAARYAVKVNELKKIFPNSTFESYASS